MSDAREELRQELCMVLIRNGVENAGVEVDAILGGYEIQKRTTEVALLSEDRNNYLFKKFLTAKIVKGCTDRTIQHYKTYLERIFDRIQKTADEVTADDIRYYLALRQKKDNVSKTTANNDLLVLRTFYQYLSTEGIIARNPTLNIDRIKDKKQRKKAFTDMEVEQIREAAENAREKAIIDILLSTGCRVSELVGIKISEIDRDKLIVHGKGEKDRLVYLNAKAVISTERYLAERSDSNPYLFPGGYNNLSGKDLWKKYRKAGGDWYKDSALVTPGTHISQGAVEQLMKKLKKRAGLECDAYPHKFRRTCATMALKRGMPIEQVSKMLGHENIATTQIYLDLNEEELEQAHRKYVV